MVTSSCSKSIILIEACQCTRPIRPIPLSPSGQPFALDDGAAGLRNFTINFGPQHPAAHGELHCQKVWPNARLGGPLSTMPEASSWLPLFAFVTLPGSILGLEAGLHSASFDKVDRRVEDHLTPSRTSTLDAMLGLSI
jgi:hypothetical protein